MCHLILALPVLGLAVFGLLPLPVAAPVYALILLVSLLLYYMIMQAMRRPVLTGAEEILQTIGLVIEVHEGKARIRVHSEIWNAESPNQLHRGDQVAIVGVNGLVLQVRRLGGDPQTNMLPAVRRGRLRSMTNAGRRQESKQGHATPNCRVHGQSPGPI